MRMRRNPSSRHWVSSPQVSAEVSLGRKRWRTGVLHTMEEVENSVRNQTLLMKFVSGVGSTRRQCTQIYP